MSEQGRLPLVWRRDRVMRVGGEEEMGREKIWKERREGQD